MSVRLNNLPMKNYEHLLMHKSSENNTFTKEKKFVDSIDISFMDLLVRMEF